MLFFASQTQRMMAPGSRRFANRSAPPRVLLRSDHVVLERMIGAIWPDAQVNEEIVDGATKTPFTISSTADALMSSATVWAPGSRAHTCTCPVEAVKNTFTIPRVSVTSNSQLTPALTFPLAMNCFLRGTDLERDNVGQRQPFIRVETQPRLVTSGNASVGLLRFQDSFRRR